MAENHQPRASVGQHGRGDGTRESARNFRVTILPAQLHRRVGQHTPHPLDQGRGRAQGHAAGRSLFLQGFRQGISLAQARAQTVHFPIAGDQLHRLFHGACLGPVVAEAKMLGCVRLRRPRDCPYRRAWRPFDAGPRQVLSR
ncbi:hypothetical protein D3C72_1658390 [compost metagenome]